VSDGGIALTLATLAIAAHVGWMSARVTSLPANAPERLVGELRLAQLAGLVLCLVAGASAGLAIAQWQVPGAGMTLALAAGFLLITTNAILREPHDALTMLAVAFLAHAVVLILHRPGWLPELIIPGWYARDCATLCVVIAALCYLPVFRRRP
jgi:hypothetical protein